MKKIHKQPLLWYTIIIGFFRLFAKHLKKMSILQRKEEKYMAKVQVSSILRALQILECFMDRETEWTLKELVDHLDLPSTTVFRQVSTLAERQYLVQDPVRKSYRVGPRLMLLASAILGQSDLRAGG